MQSFTVFFTVDMVHLGLTRKLDQLVKYIYLVSVKNMHVYG